MGYYTQRDNDEMRCAESYLDEAFSKLNQTAYRDGSTISEKQRKLIERAMNQISNAVNNVIRAID